MLRTIQIAAAITIGFILFLAYIAIREYKEKLYWKTEPMRKARHRKDQESAPVETEEERLTDLQPNTQNETSA